jgi:hypothetical protein
MVNVTVFASFAAVASGLDVGLCVGVGSGSVAVLATGVMDARRVAVGEAGALVDGAGDVDGATSTGIGAGGDVHPAIKSPVSMASATARHSFARIAPSRPSMEKEGKTWLRAGV